MPAEEMGDRHLPQPPDVATGAVIATVAGFLGFVAIAMAGFLFYSKAEAPGLFLPAKVSRFPSPALQSNPQQDLRRFKQAQRNALENYGWVDRSKEIAKIPIDQAIQVMLARGQHAYDPLDQPADIPDGHRP